MDILIMSSSFMQVPQSSSTWILGYNHS